MMNSPYPYPATSLDAYRRQYPEYGPSYFHTLGFNPELEERLRYTTSDIRLLTGGVDPYPFVLSHKVAINPDIPLNTLRYTERKAREWFNAWRLKDPERARRYPTLAEAQSGDVSVFDGIDHKDPYWRSRLSLLRYSTFLEGIEPIRHEACFALYRTDTPRSPIVDMPSLLPAHASSLFGVPPIQHIPIQRLSASRAVVHALYIPSQHPKVTRRRADHARKNIALAEPLIRKTIHQQLSPLMSYSVQEAPLQLNYACSYGIDAKDMLLFDVRTRPSRILDSFPPIFEENHSVTLHLYRSQSLASFVLLRWGLPSAPEDFIVLDTAAPEKLGSFYRATNFTRESPALTPTTETFIHHLLAYRNHKKIFIAPIMKPEDDCPPPVLPPSHQDMSTLSSHTIT